METILFYLIRASIAAAILYIAYKLLFSKKSTHANNRIFLLSFLVFSLMLPLFSIDISWVKFLQKTEPVPFDISQFNVTEITTAPIMAKPALVIPWLDILTALYIAGTVITLLFFLTSFVRMFYVVSKSEKRRLENGVTLCISTEEVSPFSWMRFLVISREDFLGDNASIVLHEKAHIAYHHSWDMLLANLYTVFFWFNPFAWLLRKELQTIHEYQADEKVITTGTDIKEYQLLLIRKCVGENKFMLANNFEYSHLHKRIKMIMKTQTKIQKRWIYSIVPLLMAAIMVVLSSEKLHAKESIKEDKSNKTTVTDSLKDKVTKVILIKNDKNDTKTINSNIEIVNIGGKSFVTEKTDDKKNTLTVVNQMQGNVQNLTITKQQNDGKTVETHIQINQDTTKLKEKPLIVVDGKEIPYEGMNNIKPENIESISVLKDKSATEMYGEKGKNGVVIITLKKTGSSNEVQMPIGSKVTIKADNTNSLQSPKTIIFLDSKKISKEEMDKLSPDKVKFISIFKSTGEQKDDNAGNAVINISTKEEKLKPNPKNPVIHAGNIAFFIDGKLSSLKDYIKLMQAKKIKQSVLSEAAVKPELVEKFNLKNSMIMEVVTKK